MKNKSVQNCRFVHHAKFHCIMTSLKRLFKFGNWGKLETGGGGTGKEPKPSIALQQITETLITK